MDRYVTMPDSPRQVATNERYCLFAATALFGLAIAALAADRTYFTFGVETDYVSTFLPEAQRFQQGGPLQLNYHPPLYSIVVALIQPMVGDWLATGLIVSWFSSLIALVSSFLLLYRLGGRYAAWGAVLGLIGSPQFAAKSATASSDAFFFALFALTVWLAFSAARLRYWYLWLASGASVGCTILARTNGLILVVLMLVPWCLPIAWTRRRTAALLLVIGTVMPLLAWVAFAKHSHSPIYPTKSHLTIAADYFGNPTLEAFGDREEMLPAHFDNTFDVLAYDPGKMLREYLKHVYQFVVGIFEVNALLAFPLSLFAVPGILLLLLGASRALWFYMLAIAGPQILIVNIPSFLPRYSLFLIPLLGAGVGACWKQLLDSGKTRLARRLIALAFIFSAVLAFDRALTFAWRDGHAVDSELGEVVPVVRVRLKDCSGLVARFAHIPLYAGCPMVRMPNLENRQELRAFLDAETVAGTTYLYYGTREARLRSGLNFLLSLENLPPWLETVAKDPERQWVLLRYRGRVHGDDVLQ